MSELDIKVEESGEGFWKVTKVIARLPEDRFHRTRMSFTRRQGNAHIEFDPLSMRISCSSDESLMERLRLLKALLNAIPEL